MTTVKLKSAFLTNNGNILNIEMSCIQTLQGEFIRLVGDKELEYLKSVLTPVDFPDGIPQPETIPTWNCLWETIYNDESNYSSDRCNNGGCYSTTIKSLYFHRNINGKNEYCRLDYTSSSSEFSQTSDGTYQNQNDIVTLILIGADIDLQYKVWSMSGQIEENTEEPLERHASIISLKEVFYAVHGGETSNYDNGCWDGGSEIYYDKLSKEEKIERFKILKSFNIDILNELYPHRYKKTSAKKIRRQRKTA